MSKITLIIGGVAGCYCRAKLKNNYLTIASWGRS